MLKKMPMKPAENLVKWVEFLAKNPDLKNLDLEGAKMGYISYFLLDIISILLLTLVTFTYLSIKLCRWFCCSRTDKILKRNKKVNWNLSNFVIKMN